MCSKAYFNQGLFWREVNLSLDSKDLKIDSSLRSLAQCMLVSSFPVYMATYYEGQSISNETFSIAFVFL